jgi:hypothetical protein
VGSGGAVIGVGGIGSSFAINSNEQDECKRSPSTENHSKLEFAVPVPRKSTVTHRCKLEISITFVVM